jgi:hypothetical protein
MENTAGRESLAWLMASCMRELVIFMQNSLGNWDMVVLRFTTQG